MIKSIKPLCIHKAVQNSINKIKGVDIMEEIYNKFGIPEYLQECFDGGKPNIDGQTKSIDEEMGVEDE